jgi:pimeloyl-[acyl-carrier protein] methyl ester esterase
MNSAVWQLCQQYLPDWVDAIFIDLPGHGSMREVQPESLDDLVQAAVAVVGRPVVWVGWSMGGLVTLKIAEHYPERVAALFQVASTPCFVQREGWPTAVEPQVFQQFAELLLRDVEQTLKRFIALQVLGLESSRELMQQLQQSLQARGLPNEQALPMGLDILMHTDMRESLTGLHHPLGWYLGTRDALVPVAVGEALLKLNPYIRLSVQQHASHAPMVSHPQEFVGALLEFIENNVHV